uniref:Carbonic anhydrase n=1 Tax=Oryza nivara TaxID=4536 RepID=A0A0E0ID83_ORYNI
MHSSTRARLLLAAAVLLLSAAPAARAQETDDERKFGYVPGTENGPGNWSRLDPRWAKCNTGNMQVVINGKAYKLKQLHWHTPSEHTVNGRRYDMELHLVHDDGNSNTVVIGNLYQIGNPDPFLLMLEPFIRRIADTKDRSEPIGVVDPQLAKSPDAVYYRYMGSLTTPPCTEGVIWTVFKRAQTVAQYQLDLLREAVADGYENNARPLQKVNNRNISIFIPDPKKD